jgi:hypothetical protein
MVAYTVKGIARPPAPNPLPFLIPRDKISASTHAVVIHYIQSQVSAAACAWILSEGERE